MKLIYKDGSTEEFEIENYSREELISILSQIETEMRKRDIQHIPSSSNGRTVASDAIN